jgi:hypothetical protein
VLASSSRGRRNRRWCEAVEGAAHTVDEHPDVGAAFTVTDSSEIELPGIRQRGDNECQVSHRGHHREHLQQPGTGEIQRHRRAGHIAYHQVHGPLPRKLPVPNALPRDEPEDPTAHLGAGLVLGGERLGGDDL